ncbi:F510_1955 family glycosylhydrolase [Alkalihalobacterium chitinilyticum]|uniref:Sortilin N-terminal domain-containing protein n=1 Tax=Alkalihalobacterium chitinilyticum TaxID=2980103 RepID=A0ABT5VEG3_9BACI|nr:hypothetical protein [Alkalihalobacterium chitinilyticum]MDE5412858.1 hypothetical protein [Alkalihalobacterium chitinilyticum]
MKKYNKKMILVSVFISGGLLLTACGQNETLPEAAPDAEAENTVEEVEVEATEEVEVEEADIVREETAEISHTHGLELNPSNPDSYLIATHYGVVEYEGPNQAYVLGEMRDDFMGFSRVADTQYLMSSGHPGHGSDLPDPLGFMWSENSGQTWEFRSLLGEYDFHALTASYQDNNHILGHALDFKNNFQSLIFRSNDQGFNWDRVETNGLPLDQHAVHDMAFSPEDDKIVFAATAKGLFKSDDSGVNWSELATGNIKGLAVLGNDEVYYFNGSNEELYRWTGEKSETISYPPEYGAVNYIVVNETGNLIMTTERSSLLKQESNENWNVLIDNGQVK